MEVYFKIAMNNISISSMFKWFESNLININAGVSKIPLTSSAEIERKIEESGGLKKFQPANYQEGMKKFVEEMNK